MELKDTITIFGLIIVVCGWLFSRWKDRSHELFKERLKKRLDMHDSVIEAMRPYLDASHTDGTVTMGTQELSERVGTARRKIHLFGYADEITEYENFVAAAIAANGEKLSRSLETLSPMIIGKIRKELGYKR